jgi:hypothetical protein
MPVTLEALGLEPLKVKCTDTDCERDLHCFKSARRTKGQPMAGPCRACGAELIEWDRVHKRDVSDRDYTFEALRNELIRHHFWHVPIDEKALAHATRKGRVALHEAAGQRIVKSVGRASARLYRDGMQTPREGNVIYYAQHATAACCRKCIEYWHDIPPDRDLTDEETAYLTYLVCRYIDERLPDLDPEPRKVPRKRRNAGPNLFGS